MQRSAKPPVAVPVGRWGEREQGILEVATALYAQGGYENITMAAVATAAGLSEGTLYNYFRDKQDLQLRVSLGVFEAYTREVEQVVETSTSLRQGLEGIIALELRLLIEAKELFRIWLREVRSSSAYAQSEARNALRRFSTQLIHLFGKWNAAPNAGSGLTLPMMRDIVFGSLEHLVWTAMVQRREDAIDVPKLSRDLAAAYLRAFALDADIADATAVQRARKGSTAKTSKRTGVGTRHTRRSRKDANSQKNSV